MKLIVLMLTLLISTGVCAEELHFVLNGKSYHLTDKQYNENNVGIGFEYDFKPDENWIPFVAASVFKDSLENTSKYAGGGIKRRYRFDNDQDGWYGDIGVIAFLMTRYDFNNNQPFFGALPFITLGHGPVALNFTYIPRVTPKSVPLFYVQAKIRLAQW